MAMLIRSSMSSRSSRHFQVSVIRPSCLSTNHWDRCRFLENRSFLQPLIMKVENGSHKKMDVVVNSAEPGTPLPFDPSGTNWELWLVGMLFSVVIPFRKNRMWPLLKFKETFSTVLHTMKDTAEMVEEVAEMVEEAADDIAVHLPEGKLRRAARFVESVAREAAKDAVLAEDVIKKAEEFEKEMDSIIEQGNQKMEVENDTENHAAKATEIKTKIAEIKQMNAVKNEKIKS
ncbi:uncharacterized protein LOC103940298 isoform X2 [Pyrus x bretschneideri]|uniref:uncharacterized protein LOC103940298 isoform X2 n=1 Tax=Pyrus x bretschneideri TaxID=225117 RepID=UPI0020307F29|nr:uncharacterized protein LOC103940298 isoform X2 [Pyrus x bretschneideri]